MPIDEQGRQYYDVPGQPGRRSYVSPVAQGTGEKPADSGGIFKGGWQWDANQGKWENPTDWGNLMNIGVGSGLGLGALHAAGALGGGAASGAGAAGGAGLLPNAALPGAAGAMTGALGTIAPTTAASALAGGLVTGATGASGSVLGQILKKLIDPKTLAALGIGAGVPLAMKAFGGGDDSGGGNDFLTPDMQRYQGMSEARFRRTDPLHEAVSQLAFQRMPMQSRAGLSLPRVPLPEK